MAESTTPDLETPANAIPLSAQILNQEVEVRRPSAVFLYSGLIFMFTALVLFILTGWSLYRVGEMAPIIEIPGSRALDGVAPTDINARDIYNFYGRILSFFLAPVLLILSAFISTYIGTRLLKAAGAIAQEIIPQRDYELLAGAIRSGNEKAITEYIRLSSLSGITGTFTKVGLTGLPLATIFLTVFLAIAGLFEEKFYDLAQLTLGAFIGSYVQKRQELSGKPQKNDDAS